jgi:four helix bundle protein
MKTFENLDAWKLSREYKQKLKIVCSSFPKNEEYRLKDQIIRSSRSITANIAEGWGRYHFQENIQFCRQSRGSLTETLDHLIEAFDSGYLNEEKLNELRYEYERVLQVLNGYIAFLKKSKEQYKT